MNATGEGSIPEQRVNIATIIIHENFDPYTKLDDIALLELEEEVDLTVYTPACMAQVSSIGHHRLFVDPDLLKQ